MKIVRDNISVERAYFTMFIIKVPILCEWFKSARCFSSINEYRFLAKRWKYLTLFFIQTVPVYVVKRVFIYIIILREGTIRDIDYNTCVTLLLSFESQWLITFIPVLIVVEIVNQIGLRHIAYSLHFIVCCRMYNHAITYIGRWHLAVAFSYFFPNSFFRMIIFPKDRFTKIDVFN